LQRSNVFRELVEQARDQHLGEPIRGRDRGVAEAGFAVDPEPDGHVSGGDLEQRLGGAGQRAARERDAEGARAVVRAARKPGDLVEVRAALGGGTGDAEDGEVAGDAAAFVDLVLPGRRYVVRD